jgi:pimeloyl-ACP methyl ester carboxylesterase
MELNLPNSGQAEWEKRDTRRPSESTMRIAIAGGGIGGMVLGLSLFDAGIKDVDIYESTSTLKELGVGINVLPHAVRELTELGLLDELSGLGVPTAELVYYSKHGQRIWGEPRGLAAGYRWSQLSIHRGQLLGVLYRAVVERLGRQRVHTGHHLVRFGQEEGRRVCGEVDQLALPAHGGRVLARLADGELHIVRGCTHLAPIERPEEVHQVVEAFLRRRGLWPASRPIPVPLQSIGG